MRERGAIARRTSCPRYNQANQPKDINDLPTPTPDFDFNDPQKAPGPDWHLDPKGGRNWVDDKGWSLHPDLGHGGKKGPHWDVHPPQGRKGTLKPDGTIVWSAPTSQAGLGDVA